MAIARTPRGKWIEEGLRALSAGGPEAVRIEALAQALGVSKGGFYGYFRNRDALLAEILDTWEREVTENVIERVERDGGDARTRLGRLFTIAGSGDSRMTSTTAELAIRDWARRDETVAERLKRVDNRRMEYMRSLFGSFCADADDVEVRCLITFSLRIGNHFVAADHGGRSRAEVLELTRKWLLR
ncbi:TetR/AcrR family transcriptional regulator [Streptomyces sp. WAC05374]|uniref:TetR/AcrR family transcriptional regulator n=1 Tax=Streptomyces sp. WAC05374 TaxID=2487420 RepID=UPI000F867ACD|nr:TetR/AcrR family transcriptional regulator [Streptomyces sp. WAC05374]RST12540.1 TetR/AcrR family transcriptional regulator [Streptomyces sp. WAC05374]TDF50667.1 TetR/AcrR family transcriptional regulator [Streptomyces sp. WAC05374]TDF56957.1 TetR/AcrR family transcriptional regulator [Streptomyces sp. WAC05374]TDF60920.1 TetR/AcrR family transcriptional regulator [Streptomyces sp. WAC05374]